MIAMDETAVFMGQDLNQQSIKKVRHQFTSLPLATKMHKLQFVSM